VASCYYCGYEFTETDFYADPWNTACPSCGVSAKEPTR